MTTEHPKPLFEDPSAPGELRDFVALARSDGPSQAQLDALAAQLTQNVGVGLVASSAEVLGSAPVAVQSASGALGLGKSVLLGKLFGGASATKFIAAVGLSIGLGAAGLYGSHARSPARTPATSPRAHTTAAAVPAANSSSAANGAGPATSIDAPPAGSREQTAADLPTQEHVEVPRASAKPSPRVPSTPAYARTFASSRAASAHSRASPELGAAAAPPTPPSELALIAQAEAARAQASRVLSLLARHAELYPQGALTQEREVLAIEALLRTGALVAGRERASQFERRYPASAHLPRVHALLARAGGE